MQSTHAFAQSEEQKDSKNNAYRAWLSKSQPCIFGKAAASQRGCSFAPPEENEILCMKKGDDDLRDTIQDYRQLWKRYALEGRHSSFVLAVVGESLANETPENV